MTAVQATTTAAPALAAVEPPRPWLDFLRAELAPTPGRFNAAVRITLAASIVLVTSITLEVPFVGVSCFIVMFLTMLAPGVTTQNSVVVAIASTLAIVVVTVSIALTMLIYRFTLDYPPLRLGAMALVFFVGMYAVRVLASPAIGILLAVVVFVTQAYADVFPDSETMVADGPLGVGGNRVRGSGRRRREPPPAARRSGTAPAPRGRRATARRCPCDHGRARKRGRAKRRCGARATRATGVCTAAEARRPCGGSQFRPQADACGADRQDSPAGPPDRSGGADSGPRRRAVSRAARATRPRRRGVRAFRGSRVLARRSTTRHARYPPSKTTTRRRRSRRYSPSSSASCASCRSPSARTLDQPGKAASVGGRRMDQSPSRPVRAQSHDRRDVLLHRLHRCRLVRYPHLHHHLHFRGARERRGSVHKSALRLIGCAIGGSLALAAIVFVVPHMTSIVQLALLVAAVTMPAAWIAMGSERTAYAGLQIAFAFYLAVLQGFAPSTDVTAMRDRLVGIFFGMVVMGLVFSYVWPERAGTAMVQSLAAAVRRMSELATGSGDTHRVRAAAWQALAQAERSAEFFAFEPEGLTPAGAEQARRIRHLVELTRRVLLAQAALLTHRETTPSDTVGPAAPHALLRTRRRRSARQCRAAGRNGLSG